MIEEVLYDENGKILYENFSKLDWFYFQQYKLNKLKDISFANVKKYFDEENNTAIKIILQLLNLTSLIYWYFFATSEKPKPFKAKAFFTTKNNHAHIIMKPIGGLLRWR